MTRILSAEEGNKKNISADSIKKIVKNGSNPGIIINKKAAEAIARILEVKARKIAKYAVKRARSQKRNTITAEDISSYLVRFGD